MVNGRVLSRRGGRGVHAGRLAVQHPPGTKGNHKRKALPEYLEADEINALIRRAESPSARLCMMLQWRAGLRITEAIRLTLADVHFTADPPEIKVRQGKGSKDRIVALHPELGAGLSTVATFGRLKPDDGLVGVSTRQAAWRWYKRSLQACYDAGDIPDGKPCGTHTLRHSAARHWLKHGVPINIVQHWLGHANLTQTATYLQLIADPGGHMQAVP